MMRSLLYLLIFCSITSCSNEINDNAAQEFIKTLEAKSAQYHEIPLNRYFMVDLNRNGSVEIIERTNRIESAYVGLLNIEISSAFNYDKIYIIEEGQYVLSDKDIGQHLELQVSQLKLWRKLVQNPINLNDDSKQLIKANEKEFLEEIDFIINEYEKRIK